jgi:hypothetical protein
MPGNPYGVTIRMFGSTRTCIARGHDWLNRATLTGNENFEQLDEIIAHFSEYRQRCHVEWNAGNCYREATWNDELGSWLLAHGFRPGGFRCVWHTDPAIAPRETLCNVTIRHFGPNDFDELFAVLSSMDARTEQENDGLRAKLLYGQRSTQWHHYVGYLDDVPCCQAAMFENGRIAYLDWGHTLEPFRKRGCHGALISQRLKDAQAAGCIQAASVTDIETQSARNLQTAGFRLAYNYVMLIRDPNS